MIKWAKRNISTLAHSKHANVMKQFNEADFFLKSNIKAVHIQALLKL